MAIVNFDAIIPKFWSEFPNPICNFSLYFVFLFSDLKFYNQVFLNSWSTFRMLPQRPVFSCISVDMLLTSCIQSFSFGKYLASFEFSHFAFCNFVASISCPFFLYILSLAPMRSEFLVQTYIDSRNLVCDVSAIFHIDSGREVHTKNLPLDGNCPLFVGCILSLNEVVLSMFSRICSVECPYSISVLFLRKVASILI